MAKELASIKRLLRASPEDPNIILEQDWDALVAAVQAALDAKSPVESPKLGTRIDLDATLFSFSLRDDGSGNLGIYVGAADAADGAQIKVATLNKSTGYVGAGTSSPVAKLDVVGSATIAGQGNVAARFGAGVTSDLLVGSVNGNAPFVGSSGAYPLSFFTNAISRMVILANGKVGINTGSPGAELEISAMDGDSDSRLQLRANGSEIAQFGVSTSLAFFDAGTKPWAFYGGNVTPGTDNTRSSGSASLRWSVVYAGTGTINTSDAREKTAVRPFNAAEIACARELHAEIGVYQWLASIEEKGEDGARLHIGLTVQRAMEIMESHGLDPWRYGFICRDEITRKTTIIETRTVQATDEVEEAYSEIEIREGVPTQVRKTRMVERQVFDMVAVVDEAGAPVTDDDSPLLHPVPRMIEVEREIEIDEPAGDRLGFRYDQLTLFILRGMV